MLKSISCNTPSVLLCRTGCVCLLVLILLCSGTGWADLGVVTEGVLGEIINKFVEEK